MSPIGRLGCAVNEAYITNKCGTGRLCDLTDATSIFWERKLDDISTAEVIVAVSGSVDDPCCLCLADVEPYCHELHITRDGEIVWMGPITSIRYSFDKVLIRADDVLGWLRVAVLEGDIDYTTATGIGPADLTTIAQDIIETALADHPVEPCVLDFIIPILSGTVGERKFVRFTDTAFDHLEALSNTGLDYTVVGRSIILGGDDLPTSAIGILTDDYIMGGAVEITKDGELMGNRFYVHFTGDAGSPAAAEGDQECYGPIERLRPDTDGLVDLASATQVAQAYLDAGRIAPRLIEFPPNTRLAPDTPWEISDMIPGQRIDVSLDRFCFPARQSFKLLEVSVKQEDGGDEEIGITLSPVNLITGTI